MKILIASSSTISIPIIKAVSQNPSNSLQGIVTNADKATGRGQARVENSLAKWCRQQGMTVHKPSTDGELGDLLSSSKSDLVITVAYGKMISSDLLRYPKYGWLNIHFSVLPRWRGAAPVQWAILSGETTTGVTIFKLDDGMDTGPVYDSIEYQIPEQASTSEVLDLLSVKASQLILSTLDKIERAVPPTPQPKDLFPRARKFSKEDGLVDWNQNKEQILRQYRALAENPGIYTHLRENRIKINEMSFTEVEKVLSPGEIALNGNKMLVGCLDGVIEIKNLTPAGRSTMGGADYLRGLGNILELNFG